MALTLRLRITGTVQGVGYRAWAVKEATAMRLTGFVRNRADGSVEVLVSGDEDNVEAFVVRAKQGPPTARVRGVDRTYAPPPTAVGFRPLPNA